MENIKMQPLTKLEQKIAEDNHNLLYSYLHRHGYSIEEFYSIAVMGYLKSIQVYNRRKDIQEKYQLGFIAEQYMRAEIFNHFKKNHTQKRQPMEIILSLDVEYSKLEDISTGANLYNCFGGKSAEDELLELEQIEEILENLSEVQKDIAKLKLEGYNNKETYLLLEIAPSTFYRELNRIKSVLEKMVG